MLRPLGWLAAVAALLALVAWLVLSSRWLEERVADRLAEVLELRLQQPVELDRLSFTLLPLGAEVRGLVVGGGEGRRPFARVDRLAVLADLSTFGGPSLHLRRVVVEQPELALDYLEDGTDNLVRWRRRGERRRDGPPLPLAIEVGVVEIRNGWLTVDDRRLPLELTARRVDARLTGAGDGWLEGRAQAGRVQARVWSGTAELDRLSWAARVRRGRVEWSAGQAQSEGLTARFSGFYRWGEERELAVDFSTQGEAALINRWGFFASPLAGEVEAAGSVAWRPQLWGVRATARAPSLRLFDRRLEQVVAVISADRNGAHVDIQQARYGDGDLAGQVTVGTAAQGRPVGLELSVAGVRLSRLLEDQQIPLRAVEARVNGSIDYRFAAGDPERGDGWADLSLEPAGASGELRFRGWAPLNIQRGVVESRALRLDSENHQVLADGSYDLAGSRGRFDYQIETAALPELLERFPGYDPDAVPAPWWPASGRGTLAGVLRLGGGTAETDLRLSLESVAAEGFSAERARGSLTASAAGLEQVRIELERQGAAALVTGGVGFGQAAPLALTFDATGWPLSDLAYWLPAGWPSPGRVAGRLLLTGTADAPEGALDVRCGPLVAAGRDLGELALEATLTPDRLAIRQARIETPAGAVRLAGLSDAAAGRLDLAVDSERLDLAAPPLAGLFAGAPAGAVELRGRLWGATAEPRMKLRVEGYDLALGGEPLGEAGRATLVVRSDGARLSADGSLLGLVRLEGGGVLDRDGADLSFAVASDRLGALARLLAGERAPPLDGELGGELSWRVASGQWWETRPELSVDRLRATTGEHTLTNLEPVSIALGGDGLEIHSLWLGEADGSSELFVNGRIVAAAAGGPAGLDLRLQSSLESAWLAALAPGVRLRGGRLDLIATVRGTTVAPQVNGVGELTGLEAFVPGLPGTFEESTAVLLFDPGEVVIDRARAVFAGGRLEAQGSVRPGRSWLQPEYQFQLRGQGLNVRYPEGWLVRGGGVAALRSVVGGRTVTGVIEVERASYQQEVAVGLEALLRELGRRTRIEEEETDAALAATALELRVEVPRLEVVNRLANLTGSADLTVRGNLASPVVFGEVRLDPGGTVDWGGSDYEVERGQLTFANPYRIEPVVDFVARTELRDYDVRLTLSGTPERLRLDLASDPPLAEIEVLSLLTAGGPAEAAAGREPRAASAGAESLLYQEASSLLTTRANRLLGLDRLRVVPLAGESGGVSSARVTLGKRLSRDLYATYSYDPSTTAQQILELEWSVTRNLLLVVTQNGDDSYAVDALWQRSF